MMCAPDAELIVAGGAEGAAACARQTDTLEIAVNAHLPALVMKSSPG
jgi:hypothetical protein